MTFSLTFSTEVDHLPRYPHKIYTPQISFTSPEVLLILQATHSLIFSRIKEIGYSNPIQTAIFKIWETFYFGLPGIQSVPAKGTLAMAADSTVRAARSSLSKWWTSDLPQARAMVATSIVSVER